VPRKLGESVEAWRNRIAALEARYDYSRAALVRGDFGSAASGFEAILRSEPGFGDAPDLLVQARAGLRAAATSLVSAGDRLEAAGDWVGAQQQYARAREMDPGHSRHRRSGGARAGTTAHRRARGPEPGPRAGTLGHPLEALQEFTKALQWLPADDSGTPVARAAERLRLLKKE
jgi:tetratricopeptide (TPR) repeat protein